MSWQSKSARALWVLLALCCVAPGQMVSESTVRAAIVLQLTNYTEWPASAFHSQQDPFYICVMGDPRLSAALAAAARTHKVYGHPVVVGLMDDIRQISTCHLVFMRYSRERQIRDAVMAVRSAPVLTVGESESLIGCGGIINLAWENGSVRFEVNQDGARKAGLIISSRLLRLARVHGMPADN